jgi:8-oxo-dGTP diphosphatase
MQNPKELDFYIELSPDPSHPSIHQIPKNVCITQEIASKLHPTDDEVITFSHKISENSSQIHFSKQPNKPKSKFPAKSIHAPSSYPQILASESLNSNLKKVFVSNTIIISADRKVLMIRRAEGNTYPHCWLCPGGSIEIGESPKEAAKREL